MLIWDMEIKCSFCGENAKTGRFHLCNRNGIPFQGGIWNLEGSLEIKYRLLAVVDKESSRKETERWMKHPGFRKQIESIEAEIAERSKREPK